MQKIVVLYFIKNKERYAFSTWCILFRVEINPRRESILRWRTKTEHAVRNQVRQERQTCWTFYMFKNLFFLIVTCWEFQQVTIIIRGSYFAVKMGLPSLIVSSTAISAIFLGSIVKGFSSRITMSASLPFSKVPLRSSS